MQNEWQYSNKWRCIPIAKVRGFTAVVPIKKPALIGAGFYGLPVVVVEIEVN
jgi:hypothetical protein